MSDKTTPKYDIHYSNADGYHLRENGRPMVTIRDANELLLTVNERDALKKELAVLKAKSITNPDHHIKVLKERAIEAPIQVAFIILEGVMVMFAGATKYAAELERKDKLIEEIYALVDADDDSYEGMRRDTMRIKEIINLERAKKK